MNIVTIFAGRRPNLEILQKYLKKALEMNIIQEVHFWNNTRNIEDEEYIKTITNLMRTSSAGEGTYILIKPEIINNSFQLNVKAKNDIHIQISNNIDEYEIVLGGWSNWRSVIRENGREINSIIQYGIADESNFNNYEFSIDENTLLIKKNNEVIMKQSIVGDFKIEKIYFKTGFNSVGHINYKTIENNGFYLMDTCEKSWKNYYQHYKDKLYINDIILKCDDDIVFIDLNKLPNFIDFVKTNDYDLVLANTINNGVSAYYQQNRYNLIPKELMDLEYPSNIGGSLWESGKKAEDLHNYFMENYKKFLDHNYNNEIIPVNSRFSINFFGYKGKNWVKIEDCYESDEYNLTVLSIITRNFKNVFYSDFYVSHLSFYKQLETGINLDDLINKYNELYKKIYNE